MDELCRLRRSEGYGICFDEPAGTKLCEAYGVQKSRRRKPSAFVLRSNVRRHGGAQRRGMMVSAWRAEMRGSDRRLS